MTGGCNRLNTFDWLASIPIPEEQRFPFVEVSFKHGSRKDFYRVSSRVDVMTGDLVVVESEGGYDVGRISLSGELVRLRMRKNRGSERRRRDVPRVLRLARDRDLENLTEARAREGAIMIRARQMVREIGMEMKIGDVEFQGDLRKATFYYTSDQRIDFRELVRRFAQEFRIKVEMRQIGARQEAGKIGGIGSCGRELCCSTWLTEFQSVSTSAARYQNLAINQSKLSGQCGRLKCCLNYELETYVEGLKAFPKGAKRLKTKEGEAFLQKTDLFRVLMYYVVPESGSTESFALSPDQVREIQALNEQGELAPSLSGMAQTDPAAEPIEEAYVENTQVSLNTLERSARKRRNKGNKGKDQRGSGRQGQGQGQGRDRGTEGRSDAQGGRRQDRPDRTDRPDRPDRPDRQEGQNRPDRNDRNDRRDRPDRPDQAKRSERQQRSGERAPGQRGEGGAEQRNEQRSGDRNEQRPPGQGKRNNRRGKKPGQGGQGGQGSQDQRDGQNRGNNRGPDAGQQRDPGQGEGRRGSSEQNPDSRPDRPRSSRGRRKPGGSKPPGSGSSEPNPGGS